MSTAPAPLSRWARAVIDFVVYYIVWFAAVYGAGHGQPWLGPVLVAVALLVHIGITPPHERRAEWLLASVLLASAIVIESVMAMTGRIIHVVPGTIIPAPPWIVLLWPLFGITITTCFAGLRSRPILMAVLGAIGGPLAFLGGQKLGALRFGDPWLLTAAILAILWAIAMPLAVWFAGKLHEKHARPAQA